jgi:competence protein ComEA
VFARTPYDPSPPPRALPGLSAFDPGRRGVKVLAIVAGAAALVVVFLAWRSGPRQEPVPVVSASAVVASPAPTELVVAVSGKVVRPGLVRLPPGSRVADAIAAAGGALPDVDLSGLNLARKLNDGELIAVGVPAAATGAGPAGPAKINLNTAVLAELDTLPGVGPVLAQRIIDHRTKRGPFRTVEDLRQVDGIGEETFTRLKDLVVV